MKSMFTMGFASHDFFGARPFLGQAEPALSENERNRLLADLSLAGDKFKAVNDWIQNHPNQAADLGPDFTNFQNYLNNASAFAETAASVAQRLTSQDASAWVVPATDWNATQNWMLFANQVYNIVVRHPTKTPTAVAPGAAAAKPATGGLSPLAIGAVAAGALAVGLAVLA